MRSTGVNFLPEVWRGTTTTGHFECAGRADETVPRRRSAKPPPPPRSDDDHVDLCGEVNEYPRRIPGFGRAGHVRGAALASQGLGFLDDLFGARLQGLVIKDGVSAIEGGS